MKKLILIFLVLSGCQELSNRISYDRSVKKVKSNFNLFVTETIKEDSIEFYNSLSDSTVRVWAANYTNDTTYLEDIVVLMNYKDSTYYVRTIYRDFYEIKNFEGRMDSVRSWILHKNPNYEKRLRE